MTAQVNYCFSPSLLPYHICRQLASLFCPCVPAYRSTVHTRRHLLPSIFHAITITCITSAPFWRPPLRRYEKRPGVLDSNSNAGSVLY